MIKIRSLYIRFLLLFLLPGYFLFGKGFAYLHIPNTFFYVGEVFLIYGLLFVIYKYKYLIVFKPFMYITLFLAWGLVITLIYFPKYRVEGLRDSAIYYYSFFSIIIFTGLRNIYRYDWLYKYLLNIFKLILIFHFILKVGSALGISIKMTVPFTEDISLYWMKFGDLGVLLAGAVTVLMIERKANKKPIFYIYIIAATFLSVMTLAYNRGGFLAFACGVSIYLLFQSTSRKLLYVSILSLTFLMIFIVIPQNISETKGRRDLSKEQIIANISSITRAPLAPYKIDGTTAWRLAFWSELVRETVNSKKYFMLGQGLGPNLAGFYGYSTQNKARPNKHPHNFTVNVFARMGSIGLMFWIIINLSYFRRLYKSISISDGPLKDLLLLMMVLWGAMIVNSSLDVYLEGPMGAIPFWCFMGIGYWLTNIAKNSTFRVQASRIAARYSHPSWVQM